MDRRVIPLPQSEEAAVIEVMEEESAAFLARDYDRWARCWVQDARTTDISSTFDRGVIVQKGWEAVGRAMRQLMNDNPEPATTPATHLDYDITVQGDMAWATYRTLCDESANQMPAQAEIYETRILERRPDGWKIVYSSVLRIRDPDHLPTVQVDFRGKVLWASDQTLAALKAHDALTISAGRLRAVRPAWDKVLQDRIAQVGRMIHLFAAGYNGPDDSDRAHYPTVLGESDEGEVIVCTVHVRNGAVAVTFDTGERDAERIATAAEIYGLSEAQHRLARRIVAGDSLGQAAEALGISINTARTHLSRIYDKTGVNAQAALVRVLLSVGAG